MKKTKKAISAVLALSCAFTPLMVTNDFSAENFVIHAEDTEELSYSGMCGENCTYSFDAETGTLTISGTGDMDAEMFKGKFKVDNLETDTFTNLKYPWEFYRWDIQSIIIEDGITSISNNAFYGLPNVSSISIADSVTKIDYCGFGGCSKLEEVVIPDSVTEMWKSFNFCNNLKSVKLSNSLTTLSGFWGCENLEEITIPESITKIDDYVFCDCNSLKEVTIPDSVTEIGEQVLENCTSLEKVNIPDGISEIKNSMCDNCISLKEVTIPASVKVIGNFAFAYCESLETVNFEGEMPDMGDFSFARTPFLKNYGSDWVTKGNKLLRYNGNDENVIIPDYITEIGEYAFSRNGKIKSVVIPDTVEKIDDYAFYYCEHLKTVEMADSVTYLGAGAFQLCVNLESVKLSDSITEIMPYTFEKCRFTDIEIPEKLISIGESAFYRCNYIKEIKIPDSVKKIDDRAFDVCKRLETIYIPSSVKYIGEDVLGYYETKDKIITHIYYNGTEEQWNNIEFKECAGGYDVCSHQNRGMKEAVMHFSNTSDILGDVNNDGEIDVRDSTRLTRYILKMEDDESIIANNADVMKDGIINIKDIGQLNKYIIKVIDKF